MKNLFLIAFILVSFTAMAQWPMVLQSDTIGVFYRQNDKLVEIPSLSYSKIKTSGLMASALTFGAANITMANEYNKAASNNILAIGDTIVFYFGNSDTKDYAKQYIFAKTNSILNFSVAKFKVKKKSRVLTTGKSNAWTGGEFGTSVSDEIKLSYRKIREGVYECVITDGTLSGEYCFMFNGVGAPAAGAYYPVYDFSVK